MIELSSAEARVLGCLVEKELTTPDYYPLTMNSLVTACNQTSNREPVANYDEATVEAAIEALREMRLVRWVKEARSRSAKYRHDLESEPGLSVPERSLLAVLLLRGPQTAGELRTRTERYHGFASLEEVEETLGRLAGREEPVTRKLARQPGQKEARWRDVWNAGRGEDLDAAPVAVSPTAASPTELSPVAGSRAEPSPSEQRVDGPGAPEPELVELIAQLTRRVDRLERELGLSEAAES